MNPMFRKLALVLLMHASISLVGCGGAQTTAPNSPADRHDHDHKTHADGHAHPESFAAAVTEVEQCRAEIKTAFASDDLAKADGPLHEIGHLLKKLPELAAKEPLSETDQQQVKQAVDSLMDSFAELDERVHSGGRAGKSYDDVANDIDKAIAKVNAIKLQETQP
jgi:hypothetical protein